MRLRALEITGKIAAHRAAAAAQGLLLASTGIPALMSRRLATCCRYRRPSRARERGFSLIELVVVVIIIAILAVIAIPSITERMRDHRTSQAAEMVSNMIRGARMRAMGRGSAVLVRFNATTNPQGSISIQEAVRGSNVADPDCKRLPVSNCTLTDWTTPVGNTLTDNVLLSTFAPNPHSQYANDYITVQGDAADPGDHKQMDLCFTPLGSAFVRYNETGAFKPLAGIPVAEVYRKPGSAIVGLVRTVMILPNGATRLGTAKGAP